MFFLTGQLLTHIYVDVGLVVSVRVWFQINKPIHVMYWLSTNKRPPTSEHPSYISLLGSKANTSLGLQNGCPLVFPAFSENN